MEQINQKQIMFAEDIKNYRQHEKEKIIEKLAKYKDEYDDYLKYCNQHKEYKICCEKAKKMFEDCDVCRSEILYNIYYIFSPKARNEYNNETLRLKIQYFGCNEKELAIKLYLEKGYDKKYIDEMKEPKCYKLMWNYFKICDKLKQNKKIDHIISKRTGYYNFNIKFIDELISILTDLNMEVTKENKVSAYGINTKNIDTLEYTNEDIILHIEII